MQIFHLINHHNLSCTHTQKKGQFIQISIFSLVISIYKNKSPFPLFMVLKHTKTKQTNKQNKTSNDCNIHIVGAKTICKWFNTANEK